MSETHPRRTGAAVRLERRSEQALPRYGSLYFNQLFAEFKVLDSSRLSLGMLDELQEIVARKQRGEVLTWHDLYIFELSLARCLPPEKLAQKVLCLRGRFGDVAGARQLSLYMATNPPDPASAPEAAVRADLEHVLGELFFRYAITPLRERERARVSMRVALVMGVTVAVTLILAAFLSYVDSFRVPAAVVVMFAGAIGGLVSMQQRYYSWSHDTDPMHDVSQIVQGWPSIFLSLFGGAVFALVLYLIFAAGLVEGSLFPKLQMAGKPSLKGLHGLLGGSAVPGNEYAKLLVWCFIAGFAERFVPDTLSRIVDPESGSPS